LDNFDRRKFEVDITARIHLAEKPSITSKTGGNKLSRKKKDLVKKQTKQALQELRGA